MNAPRTTAFPREGEGRRPPPMVPGVLLALVLLAPAPLAGAAPARSGPVPGESAARAAPVAAEPADAMPPLRDVGEWIRWKHARQLSSLPVEARLFYRRGLLAHQSGQRAEALANVRGAVELDPTLVQPHLTLAGWLALSDPAQALVHLGAAIERLRRDFNVQLDLVANVFTLGLEALLVGLVLAGALLVFVRRDELGHGFEEALARHASRSSSRWWVLVLLSLPFLAGFGLTLPVLLMLAFLWPLLRTPERALHVAIATAVLLLPLAPGVLDRFALALRSEGRPFHELPALEHAPWTPERQSRLERAVAEDERNGFAQFALAWHSRRGAELARAEKAYEAALEAWPEHPAVLTDLGNVVAMRGHTERALELYKRAAARDPHNAAAHFNAAQLLTRRFEYAAAQEELRQASALDFDLVRRYQSQSGASGRLPLVDVWPDPRTFWAAVGNASPGPSRALPLLARNRIETMGWGFSFAALLVLTAGHLFGRWRHEKLPLRHCMNCGMVVCRRCAKRRRESALCEDCERVGSGAASRDFSRVLMLQHRSQRQAVQRLLDTALAALVPGYGLLSHRRVLSPVVILSLTWLLTRLASGTPLPFSVTARLALPGSGVPAVLVWGGFLLVLLWSLIGFFVVTTREREREARDRQVARGRITQATHRETAAA